MPGEAGKLTTKECKKVLDIFFLESPRGFEGFTKVERDTYLSCAVKTGKIKLWMVPFFITSLINFLLGLAGIISVLFIVLGGYRYVLGGITDDKESGKKTITYAIVGLIVSLSAWIVINVIQYQITR
ncbi:MAG: hypothetical protein UY05_C0072G0004 [Candidatus Peregrinibacteria bacterium GW2011_GWA2_47_7]|nr:MAG: hypothetical protein UY05_C0072G0004 [Candidatus Peregrinibacteria bacterium GW2011_GWA2_47_7]